MDREYGQATPADTSTNDAGLGIHDFGMSLAVGPVPNVQAIGAKLRAGGKTLEIGFTGTGKGTGQSQTPEYYGKKQRQALIEMARANKVDFTTHSAFGVQGLAGMDQQGNFSKTAKNFSINEIKRAIEFAADVGEGGPVVVHTGEFNRPIVDSEWNQEDDQWKNKFKAYEGEEERATFRVIDARHGGTVMEARKNRTVSRPVWLRADKDYTYIDNEGKEINVKKEDYVDYEEHKVERAKRVPVFDEKGQHFKVEQLHWTDLQKEADEMTREAREDWRRWKQASEEQRKKIEKDSRWSRFFEEKLGEEEVKIRPEEAYVISSLETNAANNRGWAHYYGRGFGEELETIKKLKKAHEFYERLEETTDPEERWKLKRQAEGLAGGLVPPEAKLPSEMIKRHISQIESHMIQAQESAASQWAQAEEAEETIKHIQSAEKYALQEAYDSYAQAGIFAMRHSDRLEKEKKLKKPLAIAMENLFPESYGAHPDEVTQLVVKSREKMAELLQKPQFGYSEQQARKEAEEHITATIDTGHLNVWRKYWQGDSKKSLAENDAEFNRWLLEKLDVMIKNNVVGHMHLDDNYGYHDDHLAPGEGNAPIKEMVELLKKKGYKGELIVEPGADWTTDLGGFHSVMKTWRLFGSPLYGSAPGVAPGMRTWGQVQYGWFGQNQPPYFVFNPYTPSEEWTLWSGVPLE